MVRRREWPKLPIHFLGWQTEDVLERFWLVAQMEQPDIIVRLTADCPCLDPTLITRAVQSCARGHDYASNTLVRTYPRGLDVEAFTVDQLGRTYRQAKTSYDREHVTPFMQASANRPYSMLKTAQEPVGLSERFRWCLDTLEDYQWLSEAFRRFPDPTSTDLLTLPPRYEP